MWISSGRYAGPAVEKPDGIPKNGVHSSTQSPFVFTYVYDEGTNVRSKFIKCERIVTSVRQIVPTP